MKYARIIKDQYQHILEVCIDNEYNQFDISRENTNEDIWVVFDGDSYDVDIRLWIDSLHQPHLEIYPYNPIFVKNRYKKENYPVSETIPIWYKTDETNITKDHLSNFDATQLYCIVKTIDEDSFRKNLDIDALINASYLSRFLEFFKEEVYWFLKNREMSFQKLKIFCEEAEKQFPNEFIDFYDERFLIRD